MKAEYKKLLAAKQGDKVKIEVYNSSLKQSEWINGTFIQRVFALDHPFRVNVKTEDGRKFNECSPDCIRIV